MPITNLITYTILNIMGYAYIQVIVMNRPFKFQGPNQNKWDFFCLVTIVSPFVFYTSTIVTWRSKHSIDRSICSPDELDQCSSYEYWEVIKFNYLWWTVWYAIGLQFYYKGRAGDGLFNFSFSTDDIPTWGVSQWVILALGVSGVLIFSIFVLVKMNAAGVLRWYAIWFLGLALLHVVMIYTFPNRVSHIHHWHYGMIMCTFLCS